MYCNSASPRGDITLTIPATDGVGTLSVLADGKLVARGVPQILRTDGDDNLLLNLYGQDMVAAVRSMMIEAKDSIEVKVDFASGEPFIAAFNTNGSAAAGSSLLLACQASRSHRTGYRGSFHCGATTDVRRHQKKADSGTVLVYADARCRSAGLLQPVHE